jgi:hypothetical protein
MLTAVRRTTGDTWRSDINRVCQPGSLRLGAVRDRDIPESVLNAFEARASV